MAKAARAGKRTTQAKASGARKPAAAAAGRGFRRSAHNAAQTKTAAGHASRPSPRGTAPGAAGRSKRKLKSKPRPKAGPAVARAARRRTVTAGKPKPAATTRRGDAAANAELGVRRQAASATQLTGINLSAQSSAAARPAGRSPERVQAIVAALAAAYPHAECALHHRNAWELLVATILSAQCTDVRVNLVTPELFRRYPTPQDLAAAPLPAIEELIRTTGFYHNKAVSISGAAKKIAAEFAGEVPREMAALLTLPGVARKTASVVLGVAFGIADGIVVDTHVQRIARRLDLTAAEAPKRIERDLMAVIPRSEWIAFSHRVIAHGRQICVARKPKCDACQLERLCYSQDKTYGSNTAEHAAYAAAESAKTPASRRTG